MLSRVSKKILLEFLFENKRCVSITLIQIVFEFICRQEEMSFQFNEGWRKKIKSTLVSLSVSWNKILKRKDLQRGFLNRCSEEFVEFDMKLIYSSAEEMDIDYTKQDPLDCLFENMSISAT